MIEILITKKCRYMPPGSERKVDVAPSDKPVLVEKDQAEKMVNGNVAVYVDPPKKKAKKKVEEIYVP